MLLQPASVLGACFFSHLVRVRLQRQGVAHQPLDRDRLDLLLPPPHVKAAFRGVDHQHHRLPGQGPLNVIRAAIDVLFSQIITKVTIIVSLSVCLSRWRFHLSSDQANYDTMCVNHRVMI
jgi:hypothetical protein